MSEPHFMVRGRRCALLAGAVLLAALGACTSIKSAPPAADPPPAPRLPPPVVTRPVPPPAPVVVAPRHDLAALPADDQQAVGVLLTHMQRLRGMGVEEIRREYVIANQAYARSRAEENRLRLALVLVTPNAAIRDDARAAGLLEGALPERRGGLLGQFVLLLQGMVADRGRQVHEEQRRVEALQQKLDALKAIEQSMSERDARNAAARGREPAR